MRYVYDVFLSYAHEDVTVARTVYDRLNDAGARVFFDKISLGAGTPWKLVIPKAIRQSKIFIVLLSRASVRKTGYIQDEIREALDYVRSLPPDRIFVIPLRLEPCEPKHPALLQYTWVDLFDGFEEAIIRLLRAIRPRAARVAEAAMLESMAPPRQPPDVDVLDEVGRRQPSDVEVFDEVGRRQPPTDGALALALAARPRTTISKLGKRLNILSAESAVTYNAVRNLLAEVNLPRTTMKEFIAALEDSAPEPEALRMAIVRVARQHVLEGPLADTHGAPLTRVVALDTLAQEMHNAGLYGTASAAKNRIGHAIADDIPLRELMQTVPLGRYLVWAIVDLYEHISHLPPTEARDRVVDLLGLPRHRAGEPLLAISYRLPPSTDARVPTFCDAYAGSIWPSLFRAAPAGARYGRTVSRETFEPGLPEVVHAPVALFDAGIMRLLA